MSAGIKRVPLQYEIITFINDYIKEHDLNAGDKLPSQAELITMMGVSRSALREAIKTLEAKDILDIKNGKGVYVKEHFSDALSAQLNFTKEKELLAEMLEVRRVLEREILKLVIRNSTAEELNRLGEVVTVLMDKYRKGMRQTEEDHQFHYMIYELSHHTVFQQLIQTLSESMNRLWEFPLNMESPFTDTIPLHEELYHAICERDVKKAREINEQILGAMLRDIRQQQ